MCWKQQNACRFADAVLAVMFFDVVVLHTCFIQERSILIVCVESFFLQLLQPLSKGSVSELVLGAVFMLQPILNLDI